MSDVGIVLSKESNPIWYINIVEGLKAPFSKEQLKEITAIPRYLCMAPRL